MFKVHVHFMSVSLCVCQLSSTTKHFTVIPYQLDLEEHFWILIAHVMQGGLLSRYRQHHILHPHLVLLISEHGIT